MKTQKVWFITGASRGFGLEIVKAALANGDRVVAAVRRPESFPDQWKNNSNLLIVKLDVTNEDEAKDAAIKAILHFDRIDVLVNNAGFGLLSAIEEASAQEVKENYETNVFGLLNVTRTVLPYLRDQKSGHIINISSVGGLVGSAGWGLYASTKFAVEGITETLSKELAPLGIFATVVEPGYFRTNFLDSSSLSRTQNIIKDYDTTVGKMREFASQVSYKQPGDPEKLAAAIIKLSNAKIPPVHLPLGNDTLQAYNNKKAAFDEEISEWYDVITSTDHRDVVTK